MKICIRCKANKNVTEFHRHKGMADGHINKCRTCVKECVAEWRLVNPNCRKEEHHRNAMRKGILPWEEHVEQRRNNAEGDKARGARYSAERRSKLKKMHTDEFTSFVVNEAMELAKSREECTGIKWELDHTIPLNYHAATGLHTHHNMELVPASWNRAKSNRHDRTYFKRTTGY